MERTTAVLLLLSSVLLVLHLSGARPTKSSRQVLPPVPGYIPVYIQDGDDPPDVESIYEVASTLLDPPATAREVDSVNSEVQQAASEDKNVKESEAVIAEQLTGSVRTENELVPSAEENLPAQEVDDSEGSPGQVVEIPARINENQP